MLTRFERKWRKVLCWVTGLTIMSLIALTIALFLRANQIEEAGIIGYVTNMEAAPFLRERPGNNGPVITVLEHGTMVHITDSTSLSTGDWYFVRVDGTSGWLQAALISFEPLSSSTSRKSGSVDQKWNGFQVG